jgi:peptide deformylase
LMNEHTKRDKHDCIASFHIGSRVCAISVNGMFTVATLFNPIESSATWSNPPKQYNEEADGFPGIKLKRDRPDNIKIRIMDYDKETGSAIYKEESFDGRMAACVVHVLEILNGTQQELYSKVV